MLNRSPPLVDLKTVSPAESRTVPRTRTTLNSPEQGLTRTRLRSDLKVDRNNR